MHSEAERVKALYAAERAARLRAEEQEKAYKKARAEQLAEKDLPIWVEVINCALKHDVLGAGFVMTNWKGIWKDIPGWYSENVCRRCNVRVDQLLSDHLETIYTRTYYEKTTELLWLHFDRKTPKCFSPTRLTIYVRYGEADSQLPTPEIVY